MDNEWFWSFIDVLGGEVSEESAAAFQTALSGLEEAETREFVATLETVLRAVDLSAFAGLPVRDASDLPGGEPLPLVGTPLEYFTGALVASGEDTYRAALADPTTVLSRSWRTEDAPLLLEAVDAVHELRTGEVWDEGADYPTVDDRAMTPQRDPRSVGRRTPGASPRRAWRNDIRGILLVHGEQGEQPRATNFRETATMSGYNNYDCGYEQSWDYNDCHKPRRHGRRHQRRYNDCWDYSSSCS